MTNVYLYIIEEVMLGRGNGQGWKANEKSGTYSCPVRRFGQHNDRCTCA